VISASKLIRTSAAETPTEKNNVVLAIGVGAFVGGTVNILVVCIQAGWVIPLYIAAGLLGKQAIHGGAGTWVLGMALHYFISCTWATVYYLASRKLPFRTEYPLICGINFGVWVELFMKLVVIPHPDSMPRSRSGPRTWPGKCCFSDCRLSTASTASPQPGLLGKLFHSEILR